MATESTLSVRVAEEIRAMLGRKRITGRELARRLGVSQPWVSYRLTGHQEIGLDDLERIADALGVPLTDLLPKTVSSNGRSRHTSPERRRGPRSRVITRPNGRPRNDSTRPVSPVPPTQRRANPIRTADRPIATRFPRDHDQ